MEKYQKDFTFLMRDFKVVALILSVMIRFAPGSMYKTLAGGIIKATFTIQLPPDQGPV
jgi:hypothetical protein